MVKKNDEGKIVGLGKDKRVHRVAGWKVNLKDRIDSLTQQFGTKPQTTGEKSNGRT